LTNGTNVNHPAYGNPIGMRWLASRLAWSLGILAVLFTAIFLHAYMGWSGSTVMLVAVAALLLAIFVRLGRRFG
jgi:hypothetical protein